MQGRETEGDLAGLRRNGVRTLRRAASEVLNVCAHCARGKPGPRGRGECRYHDVIPRYLQERP